MEDFLEIELLKRREMLEKIIAEKEAALKLKGPEGHVRCVQRGNRAEYYWRKEPTFPQPASVQQSFSLSGPTTRQSLSTPRES